MFALLLTVSMCGQFNPGLSQKQIGYPMPHGDLSRAPHIQATPKVLGYRADGTAIINGFDPLHPENGNGIQTFRNAAGQELFLVDGVRWMTLAEIQAVGGINPPAPLVGSMVQKPTPKRASTSATRMAAARRQRAR